MYESTTVSENIKKKAKEKGIQLKDMLLELGLNKNMLSSMNNGSMPKADNLARIADYLGCSVDYLLGREAAAAPVQQTTERGAFVRPNAERSEIARQGEERLERLVHCWDELNPTGQGKVLDYANDLRNNDKYKKLYMPGGADELMVG